MTELTGDLLLAASRQLRREHSAELAEWGIAPGQARALRVIAAEAPIRLSILAERLRIVPRSATEVADALARLGLVERTSDPADRRATCLVLTGAGTDLRERIEKARLRASARFVDVLSEPDRRTLNRILSKLATQGEDA